MGALSLKDANARFAFLKAVSDAIAAEMASNRAEHTARLVERYKDEGTKSFDIRLGALKVANITLTVPKSTTTVTDMSAFAEWCADNAPDALVMVPGLPAIVVPAVAAYVIPPTSDRIEVDPKWVTKILATTRPADDGAVVTSEGVLVDGVTYADGGDPKSFSVRYETDGRDALALAYRRGELNPLAEGTALPAIAAAPATHGEAA